MGLSMTNGGIVLSLFSTIMFIDLLRHSNFIYFTADKSLCTPHAREEEKKHTTLISTLREKLHREENRR
jgi:hypothetical protein